MTPPSCYTPIVTAVRKQRRDTGHREPGRSRIMGPVRPPTPPASVPARRTLVLVTSPHAGRARRGLRRAEEAIARAGLVVRETIPLSDLGRLRPWLHGLTVERPL